MKRNICKLIIIVGSFMIGCTSFCKSAEKNIPRIIFDTDMGPDYDDVGAITILHALAEKGECKILATVASNKAGLTAPTIEVFNEFFGHSEIPIGIAPTNAPNITPGNHWTDSLVHKYLKNPKRTYPSAVSVYRKVLAAQPDHSVIIVTVGFLSNLDLLLKSQSNSFSPLNGRDLVKKKVKRYVAMAGKFPEGKEFNVFCDSTSSCYVFSHWPTPILFSGFEIGDKIFTGKKLANSRISGPAKDAYQYCLKTYERKPVENRSSWDLTAVLCAVRNPEKYFYISGEGTFICNPDGSNSWNPEKKSDHFFLIHKFPTQKIADQLEDLMLYQPLEK